MTHLSSSHKSHIAQLENNLLCGLVAPRRRARERGLSLEHLTGTGPAGRITQQDVERLRDLAPLPIPEDRHLLAERTSKSWRTVSHIHIGSDLEASRISFGANLVVDHRVRQQEPSFCRNFKVQRYFS